MKALSCGRCPYAYFFFAFADFLDDLPLDAADAASSGTTPPAALRQPTGRPRFLGAEPGADAAFATAGALDGAGDFVVAAFAAAAFASSGTTPPAALRQPTGRPRFLGAAPGTADFGVAGFFDDEAFAGAADFTGRTTA